MTALLWAQAEQQEKREEEIHLAELTATAKNDEEVIAKLHKVSITLPYLLVNSSFVHLWRKYIIDGPA